MKTSKIITKVIGGVVLLNVGALVGVILSGNTLKKYYPSSIPYIPTVREIVNRPDIDSIPAVDRGYLICFSHSIHDEV